MLGGNGNSDNVYANSFTVFDGELYAAGENLIDGAEIWRTSNGTTWTKVNTNGFGDADNIHIGSIIVFDGMLYASTRNDEDGAEIWHSSDGTTWSQLASGGIDAPDNYKIESLYVYNNEMYAVANNDTVGLKGWKLTEENIFERINIDGFGDSNNVSTLWNGGTIAYKDQLYIGTRNGANGGELWRHEGQENKIYLPSILKNYAQTSSGQWEVFNSPTINTLNSVSMVSINDGWAGGNDGTLLHYDGTQWTPYVIGNNINIRAISMSSSNNGWIYAYDSTKIPDDVVLRWDGTSWNQVALPANFRGAQDLSTPDDQTAFFASAVLICDPVCDDFGGLINWWDGMTWGQYDTMDLHLAHWAISMVSAADGWSVGVEKVMPAGTSQSLIQRWNGSAWSKVNVPDVGTLAEVDASSATNAWAMDIGESCCIGMVPVGPQ